MRKGVKQFCTFLHLRKKSGFKAILLHFFKSGFTTILLHFFKSGFQQPQDSGLNHICHNIPDIRDKYKHRPLYPINPP